MKVDPPSRGHARGDYGTHVRDVRREGAEVWIIVAVVIGFVIIVALTCWFLF
jgi:hypothetical protein